MADITKTIEGLEKTAEHMRSVQNTQREAGKYVSASFKMFETSCTDAIELLKEQQPMLIDVNQMKQLADGTDVWLEAKDGEVFALTVASPWFGFYYDRVENGAYRCWSARPTKEQQRMIPWGK